MKRKEYIERMAELWKKCMHMDDFYSIRMKLIYLTTETRYKKKMFETLEELVDRYNDDGETLEQELTVLLKENGIKGNW